ncbi:carbonic anhydrase [Achromobacter xylosoxidans]
MRDIERFIDGFQRFQYQYYEAAPSLYRNLRDGQHPSTLLIGCCDSRVDPAMLLGCDPGDIFTVRNVANLVPPAPRPGPSRRAGRDPVRGGPAQGGPHHRAGPRALRRHPCAYGAARRRAGEPDYLNRWMDIAEPARQRVLNQMPDAPDAERRRACEQASILISLRNLESLPSVRRALEAGTLTLHGWYFDLVAGALLAYSQRADGFLPIVCPLFTELA